MIVMTTTTTGIYLALLLLLIAAPVHGWIGSYQVFYQHRISSSSSSSTTPKRRRNGVIVHNFLNDMGDLFSGGKLEPQTDNPPPYGEPLLIINDNNNNDNTKITTKLAIQERPISFTGEDFDVRNGENNQELICRVRGAMLHLPGKDKMRIINAATNQVCATLDRKLVAITPTYDIYRGDCKEKIGWIEKCQFLPFQDYFQVYENDKGTALYKLEGDFLERSFTMKSNKNDELVAKFWKDGIFQFDEFNHYKVEIAPGMDVGLVIVCACAIDEEYDEEHKKKKKK